MTNPQKKKAKGQRGSRHAPPTNAIQPGQVLNPGGRPKTDPELVEAFRGRTMQALATLDKVMADFARDAVTDKGDPLIPAAAATKAAEVVLNRAWGSAPATIKLDATLDATVKGEVRQPLEVDPAKFEKVAAVLARAGVLLSAGKGEE